jgi:chorismate mutase/prephenate dehydratase
MPRSADQMPGAEPTLADLRHRIDAIDDAIHDLVMERMAVAEHIRAAKSSNAAGSYMRPAREATVLRRLLARHRGPFPRPALVRIWRELMSANLRLQGPLRIAVLAADDAAPLRDLARDHFGADVPLASLAAADAVLAEVRRDAATVGVLPLPRDGEPRPWWPSLAASEERAGADFPPRIIARLPFLPTAAGAAEALVVGRATPEPSGADHSLVAFSCGDGEDGVELPGRLARAGLDGAVMARCWDRERSLALAVVPGLVADGDDRLQYLGAGEPESAAAARVLGSYADPFPAPDPKARP